ncbi:MAG: hypothetical protein OEV46_04545 [Betaproteobacteria bacterium]|jgi:hypothetical protein|nr:hypothetical protein [Betaproteobacteria bacterium]
MTAKSVARTGQAGGAMLTLVAVVALLALAYIGYRALGFYRENVAPFVADASNVVSRVASTARSLNPYKVTKDPDEVAQSLRTSFGIAPPEGYVGAFGFSVELLGEKHMQLVALIPKGAKASDIFEGGRGEIRFSPGASTIFLAAQSRRSDRNEVREAIAGMTGGDGQTEPLQPVYIQAGGRKVAAYRGTAQSYGAWNTVVFVFLDEGRLFYAAGPKASFDEQALERALTALVSAHPANELMYQHQKADAVAAPRSDPCGIPGLAGDFDVVVVSVRRGSTPLDVALDQSGHDVAREDVVIGTTPKPIVLVLMGHDPIVWNVGRTEGARIAGVLAEGMYRQVVIGLPKSTPLSTYSTSDGPNACQHFTAERPDSSEYRAVQRRIRELFGRGIGTFLNKKAGGHFLVGEANGDIAYSPDVTLKSVALGDNVLPGGTRGIERLLSQRAIRPATDEDIAAWVKGAAQRLGQPADQYRGRINWRLRKDDTYVVLQPFDLPAGLAGANARTFILPIGAQRPGGPQGHCTFLQMEHFQCYGVGCV